MTIILPQSEAILDPLIFVYFILMVYPPFIFIMYLSAAENFLNVEY